MFSCYLSWCENLTNFSLMIFFNEIMLICCQADRVNDQLDRVEFELKNNSPEPNEQFD